MIAAAPFDWVPVVVSVGSLALGSFLTMIGQALSDRRTRAREATARRDQLRIQLYQEEREVLHQLQDLMLDLHLANYHFQADAMELDPEGFPQAISTLPIRSTMELTAKQIALYHRCRTESVLGAGASYTQAVAGWLQTNSQQDMATHWGTVHRAFITLQQAIGEALKRSPLSVVDAEKS